MKASSRLPSGPADSMRSVPRFCITAFCISIDRFPQNTAPTRLSRDLVKVWNPQHRGPGQLIDWPQTCREFSFLVQSLLSTTQGVRRRYVAGFLVVIPRESGSDAGPRCHSKNEQHIGEFLWKTVHRNPNSCVPEPIRRAIHQHHLPTRSGMEGLYRPTDQIFRSFNE